MSDSDIEYDELACELCYGDVTEETVVMDDRDRVGWVLCRECAGSVARRYAGGAGRTPELNPMLVGLVFGVVLVAGIVAAAVALAAIRAW